ncbi:MAG TPA: glycoside hydrolase, partial [Verrucomicrobiota bacterium]|nr:glycoside hydrolase [Verrucomicrobiota bacterium]
DGLWIDKLTFGSVDRIFTVANLDAGEDGTLPPNTLASCTVRWDDVQQVIDGFGASSAWRSQWNATLANMLFSTNTGNSVGRNGAPFAYTGIGLSLLRTRIAPGGTTVESSIMQMAQARGARVWSAPWSPAPAVQFKSNGNVNGGSFIGNETNYQAYAGQLARYVVNMKNQYGINLYALSIQNEPDANVTTYESCNWTSQQIHDFVPYLHAALAASNVGSTKIMLPESQNWTDPQGLRLTTMNNPTTVEMVGIIANHNYVPNNAIGDQNPPAAIDNYGKALWQTEVSKLSGDDSSIEDGLYWARRVHQFMTVAQANAWHYWWLCAFGTSNEGLCDTNDVPAKRMYTLGHFSRFVRPGFHRIVVTNATGPVLVSAYKNLTNGSFAVVCVNESTTNVTQTFNMQGVIVGPAVVPWLTSASESLSPQTPIDVGGSQFVGTVPARSVVTFVGQESPPNTPPFLVAIPDLVTNAGETLNVTNVVEDAGLPHQSHVFDLLAGPTNATLNVTSGVFTWKPLVNQADTTNIVTIKVTDDGVPNLSDTNSFVIVVNPVVTPAFVPVEVNDGQMSFVVTGPTGLEYTLLTSTNFADWETLLVTNPAFMPITVTLTNSAEPQRFYKIRLGP